MNREYLRGLSNSVEDQRSGDVVSYIHHLGAAYQEVHDPIAQGGVETVRGRVPKTIRIID